MSINWIKITERAREGIKIINSLNHETFCTVLDYVHRNMCPTEDHNEPENALEDLEKLVGVPRTDFLLLIKTLSYILKRTSTFIIKPTKLQEELREKLQLNEDKIDAIIRLWVNNTKPIIENLGKYESSEVKDVAWKLNVQISSHCQQREKTAVAVLQLKIGENSGDYVNWEMNHDELLNVYNQFENIQSELDAISSK